MKRLSTILILIFTMSIGLAYSQNDDMPVAKPVTEGVFIFLGKTIPKGMKYQVERKSRNDRSYENLGTATAPGSRDEMLKRVAEYQKYFKTIDPPKADELDKLWNYIDKYLTTDSMFVSNLPVMHLAAGTAFLDRTAEKNNDYQYRVTLLSAASKQVYQRESNRISALRPVQWPKIEFAEKEFVNGKISITWKTANPADMAHFNVYRSVFGRDDFKKLDGPNIDKGVYMKEDQYYMLCIDPLGNNPAMYEYEIVPVDAYGNEGTRQANMSGSNIEDYYVPPVTSLKAVSDAANHQIILSWSFEGKEYLNGIDIMRSNNFDDGYVRIATIPVSETSYTDIVPETGENYYYYLQILSESRVISPSAKVFVAYTGADMAVDAPSDIDAVPLAGGVNIHWKSGGYQGKGFMVFRRSNPGEEFRQVSHLINGNTNLFSYTDTSRILRGGEVYQYVVRAISNDDKNSASSDTVSVSPGIKVHLTPPVHLTADVDDKSVSLLWDYMNRWDNNLVGYKIWRKNETNQWQLLDNDSFQPAKNFFDDTLTSPGVYTYGVASWDSFGNESEKSVITVTIEGVQPVAPPAAIKAFQSGDAAFLSWGQIIGNISGFKIYRSVAGGNPEAIRTIPKDADSYTDNNVERGKLYFYQISVLDENQNEGPLSENVPVRIK